MNMRSEAESKGIQLEAPLKMSLERAIEYIGADEFVEAAPKSLRLLANAPRPRCQRDQFVIWRSLRRPKDCRPWASRNENGAMEAWHDGRRLHFLVSWLSRLLGLS